MELLVKCKTLRHVVSSAAEAEVAGVFHNAGMALPLCHFLECLGHPQPPTPIKTDNSTATGFIYDNIHQRRSKSWDMRYYWLRDRSNQQQFNIYWDKGVNNHADYPTKHHPTIVHRNKRERYVKDKINLLRLSFQQTPKTVPSEGVLLPSYFPPGRTDYRPPSCSHPDPLGCPGTRIAHVGACLPNTQNLTEARGFRSSS